MTLAQQLRELREKASAKGPFRLDLDGLHSTVPGHIPIDAEKHGAFLQAVWKMDDEERSPQCEASAELVVSLLNNLDTIIAALEAAEVKPCASS